MRLLLARLNLYLHHLYRRLLYSLLDHYLILAFSFSFFPGAVEDPLSFHAYNPSCFHRWPYRTHILIIHYLPLIALFHILFALIDGFALFTGFEVLNSPEQFNYFIHHLNQMYLLFVCSQCEIKGCSDCLKIVNFPRQSSFSC